ncbi:phenylalanine--tRNA ligase subunit beta [Roseibacillus ishigakijimensis]|uniref:Phenylalanine--tRNA ligase beta subunit n=1 Tax=Roseibacillus ishigakijimensis TaxID=454146 RepID=A0A934VKA6_9BACT|nr:phenylalanine--tRNA ligase subunit beta [Roseibacillus ishigakijimensis]MBK1833449.1 phenylalanine--tRNA ligase subunit beta [Roseibacillus ishigakijimensis]
MNTSLSWLNDHIDLAGLSTAELSKLLTFSGIEVEGVASKGVPSEHIVVAQIKEAQPHPDADKLKVCQVDAGEGEWRQIVCGAKNYAVGDKVPCALPGSDLGGGFVIREGKLRGVASLGMLCAASEIGLPDAEDGLMILPAEAPVGEKMQNLYPSDTIFELEVTPNRPDSLSHRGVARELSVLSKRDLKELADSPLVSTPGSVKLESATCPYYSATRITGVTVGESPAWLKSKLEAIGLKSINNVVDITNYVLHDLGQPLHAFDAAKVSGNLVVRQAKEGELFKALDDNEYLLTGEDCLISDESGAALALAGVMGGLDSGVTESTTDLILESAWFTPSEIRRTSRRLILSSDSSYRFERQADPGQVLPAAARAIALILELAGGKAEPTAVSGERPAAFPAVSFSEEQLAQVSAGSISLSEAVDCLTRLGLTDNGDGTWQIPSNRPDLVRPIDLVEEVVRVIGFDRIPVRTLAHAVPSSSSDHFYDAEISVKKHLSSLGFYECQTIKLIAEGQVADLLPLKPLQEADVIRVALPLSEDHAVMRPSLAPGLVASAANNARQGAKAIRLFESGTCFRHFGGGKKKDNEFPVLALLMTGQQNPPSWAATHPAGSDLYDLKAILQSLAPNLPLTFKPKDLAGYLLTATVHLGEANIGVVGRLAPQRCRELDLPLETHVAELDLAKLVNLLRQESPVVDLPQFPGSSRDVAMELPLDLPAADIENALARFKEPLLVSARCVSLFSDPSGEKIAADKKSVAYSLLYRSENKTLKAKEVDEAHQALLAHLEKSLPVAFR